jgi:capsular exopolysaccharide synthesis family protein
MNVRFKIPTTIDAEPIGRGFDPRVYLNFVWRHWMFIGAAVALALVMALIYLARATPLYTASTQVLLEQGDKPPALQAVIGEARSDQFSYIENQLAILRSDSLLRRVVTKERLASGQGSNDPKAVENAILGQINRLRGALSVSRSGQAEVLNIAITWDEPVRAGELANAVADAYVVDQLDARFEAAKRASGWLSDRLVELRQQLRDSEEAATKFRNEHGLTRSGPTVALNDQQLSELNSKLIAARADVAEKKTRVDFLGEVAAGNKRLDSLPDSFQSQSSVLGALRGRLADASQREADLLARYNSRHPSVVNVVAEKRDIEHSIAAETARMAQAIKSEYALAKARLDATEQAMREATGQGGLDNDDAVRLRELERTAAVNKSLFEDFLQKAKVTEEQSTFRAREARMIVPAQAGGQTSPNKNRIFMMALMAGLAFGIGGAFLMEMLSAGFTTPNQIEEALGIPVLASVRQMDKGALVKDGKAFALPLYQLHHPISPFAEALRTLRSSIHMSDVDKPPKVIHVTSARPGEGKTSIALSLAISAASSGLKVVMIDADLRHPSASRFFALENTKGLVDILVGGTSTRDVLALQKQKESKLFTIPAGSKTMNPPDVLNSERMRTLVSNLSEEFDYVVIDSPPVGPVIDATIIARLADATVFVVEWGSTARELVTRTIQQLSSQKRICGVVLNRVVPDRAKKYGGEYFYGKSYEKYYTQS